MPVTRCSQLLVQAGGSSLELTTDVWWHCACALRVLGCLCHRTGVKASLPTTLDLLLCEAGHISGMGARHTGTGSLHTPRRCWPFFFCKPQCQGGSKMKLPLSRCVFFPQLLPALGALLTTRCNDVQQITSGPPCYPTHLTSS